MSAIAAENAATKDDKHNIFFIIGAPTKLTFHEFKVFCGDKDGKATKPNVKLAICADIDTHKKSLECENVFKTPTNFRAHGDDKGHAFLTMDGEKEVKKSLNNLDDFKELQQDTAESIYDILKYAKDNKIHTYFASVPRELRPILLHKELGNKEKQIEMIEAKFGKGSQDSEGLLAKLNDIHSSSPGTYDQQDDKGNSVYPHIISGNYILKNADFDLIKLILKKLGDEVIGNLRDNINNTDITKYGATFLADVITVGCALLIGDETAWKHYDISFDEGNNKDKGEKKTKPKIYWGNSNFKFANEECKCTGVQQENISYEENASGFFHGFNAEKALTKLTKKMTEALEPDELKKIWGNCYVWHDDKLNDVDDEPAITLIKQLSGKVELCKSYEPKPVGSTGGGYKKSYGKKKKTKKTRRKTKNMRRKSKTKKKSTRKKKHYKKRKSKTHKKR
jgi:hypothetical protein